MPCAAEGVHPIALLAVSVGAGPALAAAADPALAGDVSAVLTLGGYASARALLRYTLTGAARDLPPGGHARPDEGAIALFVAANGDLMDAAARRLTDNRDPAAAETLLAGLGDSAQRLLDALSPSGTWRVCARRSSSCMDATIRRYRSRRAGGWRRAAARAGRPARLAVVGAVGHVEPGVGARVAELARLGALFHAFAATSAGRAP